LISVLLPALNRARQSANVIDCQARLRQMGQALQIYTTSNRGLLPWGLVDRSDLATWTNPGTRASQTPSNKEMHWWWFFTLSELMNRNLLDANSSSPTFGLVTNLSPIFRDKDTIQGMDARYVNHYTSNRRVLDEVGASPGGDPQFGIAQKDMTQRKVTSVKQSSNIFV